MYKFRFGTEIIAGENVLDHIGKNALQYGKRALIVTDKGVRQNGLLEPIEASLQDAGLDYFIFDEVISNPTTKNVEEAYQFFKKHQCEFLIGVGGGSPLDTAKSVAVVASNGGSILDYEGSDLVKKPALPVLTVPSTVGTGAEVTCATVITDPERSFKFVVISPNMYPTQAYLDPRMVENLPAPLCAATGMDALTHALEAYISRGASPISDSMAIYVIGMIGRYLRPAVAGNREARFQMLVASCMAGIVDVTAGLGLVHALANTMGGYFPVHHGVANAILLPHVMEFNLIANPKKFIDIAVALGEQVQGLSEREAAERAVTAVKKLSLDVRIPNNLSEVGITEDMIPVMAESAMSALDRPPNPRVNNVEDLKALYRIAFDYQP